MRPNIKLVENTINLYTHLERVEYSLKDVMVIGEYTTEEGPFNDDWFLVFVKKNGNKFQLSVYDIIANTNTFYDSLSHLFGAEIKPKLANSTSMESNILWPPEMIGKSFMSFVPESKNTIRERVTSALKGTLYTIELSKEVLNFLSQDQTN